MAEHGEPLESGEFKPAAQRAAEPDLESAGVALEAAAEAAVEAAVEVAVEAAVKPAPEPAPEPAPLAAVLFRGRVVLVGQRPAVQPAAPAAAQPAALRAAVPAAQPTGQLGVSPVSQLVAEPARWDPAAPPAVEPARVDNRKFGIAGSAFYLYDAIQIQASLCGGVPMLLAQIREAHFQKKRLITSSNRFENSLSYIKKTKKRKGKKEKFKEKIHSLIFSLPSLENSVSYK